MRSRLVSTVSRAPVTLLRTVVAVLAASLWVTGCEEPEPSTPAQIVANPDGGEGLIPVAVSQVTINVLGLAGKGLVVRIGQDENYQINENGKYPVRLETPVDDALLDVLAQPEAPAQTCAVQKLDRLSFAITCTARRYKVSGTVTGLEGTGLVLTDQTGEQLAVSESGSFAFSTELDVGAAFLVELSGEITMPRQTCALSGGAGKVAADGTTNLSVACSTKAYFITTNVSGLTESGLQIITGPGVVVPVPKAGTFRYETPFPDGYAYSIDISQQPTTGNQRCVVQDGHGTIDGADTQINIICDALGGIRISEIGACPFSNSSCWIEIINVNAWQLPEQLGFYSLRTTAISPKGVKSEYVFKLPLVTVPYLGMVVLQANTSTALPDGNNVLHVGDGATVPWWNGDGFVEILHDNDADGDNDDVTTDFIRFGKNKTEPRTGGTWAGGVAAGLPTGVNAYGYSLAHTPKQVVINDPAYWEVHAFATPGGSNDVVNDIDNDKDGIPDSAEVQGGTYVGVDVHAMGARLAQKDVFVELDRMKSTDAAVIPRREALDKLVAVYAKRGISVHFDAGDLFSASFNPAAYNLGGGNEVPFAKGIGLAPQDEGLADLYAIKAANMTSARRAFFYYQLFAWSQQADGSGGSSGIGELPGNDSIITLGGFGLKTSSALQTNLVVNYQAATMMHELGHNLGLRHGGADQINRKPNYVSVMNYLYSPLGLPTIGNVEGDRYDIYERCSVFSVAQLTNAPTGDVSKFVLDYSDGLSEDINEGALVEKSGLGRNNSVDVDYNCNGKVDSAYSRDLNDDGNMSLLADHDDWASLSFTFQRTSAGNENGAALLFLNPPTTSDSFTADQRHLTDLPCGAMDPELLLAD
jgi:hypothetical protein